MKIFIYFLVVFNFYGVVAQEKPNIIVIFTDDQGYADIGVNGQADDIKTPNIDALANTGVRMTSGYVTAPQCIPSRSGLLTGRYQQRFGLDHNGTIPLPLDEVLIGERMQQAGYVTGMAGKWHLDPNHQSTEWIKEHIPAIKDKRNYEPSDIPFALKIPYMSSHRGFQQTFEGYVNNYWATYSLDGKDIEAQWVEQEGYRLDIQTDAAVSFIKKNKDNPFFFYLSYFAPHVPMAATEKYLNRFPEDMPIRRRYCLAMMSAIDDGVGKIKETLISLGIDQNTIIFFMSDNGAPLKINMKDVPISFQGGAWDGSLNTPLVGEKGMIAEGGIRVPFIVNWPKGLPKGIVYDKPVISLDVAATCVALAGLKPVKELDGTNLIPYLNGKDLGDPHEALYWRFWQQKAIRMGNYKFLKWNGHEFLFDLSDLRGEEVNIIDKYPKKARAMKKKLDKWNNGLMHKNLAKEGVGTTQESIYYNHYFSLND